jgi:cation:H+ antiporter
VARSSLLKLAIAVIVALPAFILRIAGQELDPYYALFVYGTAVVGAAVLLAWAAETAQLDISGSLAIAVLALIAVLPEYAVDLFFAYRAGSDPTYAHYAAANMTGSNRLLLGFGWPLVALVAGISLRRARKKRAKQGPREVVPVAVAQALSSTDVVLPTAEPSDGWPPEAETVTTLTAQRGPTLRLRERRRIELLFLGIAAIVSFSIPIFGSISIFAGVALLLVYCVYLWRVAKEEREEPELIGVCAYIGCLSRTNRRLVVIGMFVVAAAFILASAEPFAESLVATGRNLGIDEFLLVQWLAPLVSESPELIVACLMACRLKGDDAIGTLLSSKVNQWTLLVGTIPLAYLAGGGNGLLPLDGRQTEEFILTAAQTVLGFAVLLNLRFTWREAVALAALFFFQFPFPETTVRLGFSAAYIVLAAVIIYRERGSLRPMFRYVFARHSATEAPVVTVAPDKEDCTRL